MIRQQYAEESQAALHPRSSASHTTQRVYDESVTRVLLAARADLKSRGWDYGPMSVRFEIAIEEHLEPPIPECKDPPDFGLQRVATSLGGGHGAGTGTPGIK